MLEVLLLDKRATSEPLASQRAHGVPAVEDSLVGGIHRISKFTVMAIEIKPFQALEPSQKP